MTEAEESPQGELGFMRVGDKLRMAREGLGLSLTDVSNKTRVAVRYLHAIEQSDYDQLPGRTYAVGFVRAFARCVGLPEAELAGKLRRELNDNPLHHDTEAERFEPANPAQLPTRRLAWAAAILALVLVGAFLGWRSIFVGDGAEVMTAEGPFGAADSAQGTAEAPSSGDAGTDVPAQSAAVASPPGAAGADAAVVTLVGLDDVWIGFDDAAGKTENWRTLRRGQPYQVPADYVRQFTLRTSQPNLLQVNVGDQELGMLGDSAVLVKNISLKPADLRARLRPTAASAAVTSTEN